MINKKATLILQNGTIFHGNLLGSYGETSGEICFNTGMTGYQEILTDPSYSGQLITMTYPHIGNYGINYEDIESNKIQAAGLIIREESLFPSNYRSIKSLGDYLQENNIIGIQNIDTRKLVRIIRNEGAMNGLITTKNQNTESLINKVNNIPSMNGQDLVTKVTCSKKYSWNKNKNNKYKIGVIDFGVKYNILRILETYNCELIIFPADTDAKDILKTNPDGILLSNGPGNPSAVTYGINTVKAILGKKPICLSKFDDTFFINL